MRRRDVLLGGVAASVPAWAAAQCVTDTVAVDACKGGVYVGGGAGAPSLDLNFVGGTLDPRLVFTRGAGPASYFDVAGVIQTAGTNVARFDYDPVTHAAKGILLEEARTNLLLNSATLGTQSVTTTAVAHTLSFYGTGTVTLTGTSTAGPLVGAGAFPARNALTFTPTAGTLTLTVTGSVLNANLEAGSFATSWIATTGASALRPIDNLNMPAANMTPWYSATAGSWAVNATSQPTLVARRMVNNLTGTAVWPLYLQGTNNALASSDGVVLTTANLVAQGVAFKAASSWTAGGAQVCLNGGTVASSALLVTGFGSLLTSGLRFFADGAGGAPNTGWITRIAYWSRVLSAAELQGATT